MDIKSYADAGVDIDKGERFAEFIGAIKSKAVSPGIGGFAGGVELDLKGYSNPVLLSATDGVGTKLMVAQELGKYDTLGIDLVAMSANDLAVCGAFPLVFLDYIGCGRLNEEILREVIKGIVTGCEQAQCTLAGGETAEMPDLYPGDDFDLAGFCVGLVEKTRMLPRKDQIAAGDVILGMASSGIHSNGLSLARKVIPKTEKNLWEQLLVPTRIYVPELKALLATHRVLGAAHITGGGLTGNLQRVLPPGVTPRFTEDWPVPEIFTAIETRGNIDPSEMERVFNRGIGMALVVKEKDASLLLSLAGENHFDLSVIGELIGG
jgi:phosphoribosylformylglycinamidine cyclo-ligase